MVDFPQRPEKPVPPREEARNNKVRSLQLLTPREREVLKLIAKGCTNAEIAERLYISRHTVKNHVSNIYRKIGVDDRTQVAILAIRKGLVSLD